VVCAPGLAPNTLRALLHNMETHSSSTPSALYVAPREGGDTVTTVPGIIKSSQQFISVIQSVKMGKRSKTHLQWGKVDSEDSQC
jgi:thioredoxin-related protein